MLEALRRRGRRRREVGESFARRSWSFRKVACPAATVTPRSLDATSRALPATRKRRAIRGLRFWVGEDRPVVVAGRTSWRWG